MVMSSSLLYLGYNLYAHTNKLFFMPKLYKMQEDFSLIFPIILSLGCKYHEPPYVPSHPAWNYR